MSLSGKSPLHQILQWSLSRPEWQRDALRRIVEKGEVNNEDIEELERISRANLKIAAVKPIPLAAVPISEAHLPPAPGVAQSVSLLSIGKLQGVNRLPSGANLPFGDGTGLTVVYGENGAGKSSYARVLKRACRARGAPPAIVPNAFEPLSLTKPASAEITFRLGGADITVPWAPSVVADPRLANVFVFDSFSANHYVGSDNTAAFTPYGLDVLPILSKICDLLADRLKMAIKGWRLQIDKVASAWKYEKDTDVGRFLQRLSATITEPQIHSIASFDKNQLLRLIDLRETFKSDPLQKAKETRAAIARLESFIKKIVGAMTDLSMENVEQIKQYLKDAKDAEIAAKAFAAGQFDSSFLNGTGSDLWRTLWTAARNYSQAEAYSEKAFPVLTDESKCVLCQQNLDANASQRLSRFDAFCRDTSQQLFENTEKLLRESGQALSSLPELLPELQKVDADFVNLSPEQRTLLSEFLNNSDARLKNLRRSISERTWLELPDFSASPESILKGLLESLDIRAKTEESAHDQETRKKLAQEMKELEAREWLSGVKSEISEQVATYKIIAELDECKKDFGTTKITEKSTELTKQFVTENFQQCFVRELKKLGLRTLEVKLEPTQGKKGETKFGLRLVAAGNTKVLDIASEGEQRCIALAAFLSELSQSSHSSALVFDDPVSSLDHWHRERIAVRLVEEAKTRQVIVFTHDAVFLNDLQSISYRASATPNVCHLQWCGNAPGKYVNGLPWDLKSVDDRFDKLEKEQRSISASWNAIPNEENVQAIRRAYSWLRATLERIVEKEIFSDVVFRFRSYINIKNLDGVIGFTAEECIELQRLVQNCHDVTDAHDAAQGKQAAIPEPSELEKDIISAKALLQVIRARRKQSSVKTVTPSLAKS